MMCFIRKLTLISRTRIRYDPQDGGDVYNEEVIFYCKAGVRSTNASAIAKEAGYTKYMSEMTIIDDRIGNYKGSFDDWLTGFVLPLRNPTTDE